MSVSLVIFVHEVFVNIVLLGGFFTEWEKDQVIQKFKGGMQYAADTIHKNYTGGFFQSERVQTVSVIDLSFIGAYPNAIEKIFSALESKELLGRATASYVRF